MLACGGSGGGSAASDSAGPWPTPPTSVAYASKYGTLRPAKVVSSTGVTNPENAKTGESITLTYPAGGTAPSIVLDYGQIVGGYPQFQVTALEGAPTLNTTFTEAFTYVDTGDQTPYLETALEPARSMNYSLISPSFVRNQLLQGGQRYQKLSLTSPGTSVTLSAVSLDSTLAAPNVSPDAAGYFSSSDATLNAIWQAGAYTLEANRIDAFKLPSPWTLTSEGALIAPSNPAMYQGLSFNGTGGVTTFLFRVEKGGVSWTVNATFPSTVQFTLRATDDATGPNTLTGSAGGSFSAFLRAPLDSVSLADKGITLTPGTWHTVTTTCAPIFSGGTITVSLDGTDIVTGLNPAEAIAASPLAAAIPSYLALGSFGFFNQVGHFATIKDVSLSATDLHTFTPKTYTAAFTDGDSSVLDDFGVGTNLVAALTDGAKRDREVWSGDLLVSGPSLYYSTGNPEPIQGSLTLLGKYVDADGQVASVLPPQSSLELNENRSAAPSNPWYSLGYSMYFVNILHDYYIHTGDLSLVSRLWPSAQQELAYLAGKQDGTSHLLVTDSGSGFTWHPQFDATQAGTVAEFNVDYVRTLQLASELATAQGLDTDAASYSATAATVKTAVNETLFNGSVYEISNNRTGYVAQDVNSKAVLYGVAPEDKVEGIFSAMDSALDNTYGRLAFDQAYFTAYNNGAGVVSPFISNWEMLARLEKGDTAGALALIGKVWGRMMTESNYYSGATWESFNATTGYPVDDSISLAHAWSSGPTGALSKYVLGVRPVSAGFRTWIIKPQMGSLSWASGRVPTPYGPITFKWAKNHEGTPFKAELVVPAGTSGTLAVPVVSGAQVVRIDGTVVTPASSSTLGGVTYLNLTGIQPGTYTIEVKNS